MQDYKTRVNTNDYACLMHKNASGMVTDHGLQIASRFLLSFDGFEEGFEISFAEAAASFALDDLVEDGGSVFDGAGEDLEHVAFIVAVDENAEALELVDGLVDFADAVLQLGVVGVGDGQEVYSLLLHLRDGFDYVVRGKGDVLHAGTLVEIEILLDLGFPAAFGGLVDGEFDEAVAVGHDFGHEGGVFGGDVVVVEVLVEGEAHDAGVEIDPVVHGVPAYVADHVVDVEEADGTGDVVVLDGSVSGEESAGVVGAIDEGVDGIAVGCDAGDGDAAVAVGELYRLLNAAGSATGGFEPSLAGVVDPEGYGADAVAVGVDVAGDVGVGTQGCSQHETDFTLLEDVRGAVAMAGFWACVGDERHAEGCSVEVSCLTGIAYEELDVVGAFEGEEVGRLRGLGLVQCGCSHGESPIPDAPERICRPWKGWLEEHAKL
jgi:hypothetical protein